MNGGTITGNIAQNGGGGVCVSGGIINKTGGIITGYSSDATNGNRVRNVSGTIVNNGGHAVYAADEHGGTIRLMESTAGTEVNLLFNGIGSSAAWSGNWDY